MHVNFLMNAKFEYVMKTYMYVQYFNVFFLQLYEYTVHSGVKPYWMSLGATRQ